MFFKRDLKKAREQTDGQVQENFTPKGQLQKRLIMQKMK